MEAGNATGLDRLREDGPYEHLVLPGDVVIDRAMASAEAEALIAANAWHRFQMPAYHLTASNGQGVSLVNIGVGPSNAKTMTDHIAVLRPHCWLMIGHCAGLRQSQVIGDYVLAHAYLRRDSILDDAVPLMAPIPALAEVQVALQEAVAKVTGDRGEALKRRLRTGTVVTNDDRNWELRWSQERRLINVSRAIADIRAAIGHGAVVAVFSAGVMGLVTRRPILAGLVAIAGMTLALTLANAYHVGAVAAVIAVGLAVLVRPTVPADRGVHGAVLAVATQ